MTKCTCNHSEGDCCEICLPQPDKVETKEDIHLALSLIRDRDDCPENITEMIDEIRYSKFFNLK